MNNFHMKISRFTVITITVTNWLADKLLTNNGALVHGLMPNMSAYNFKNNRSQFWRE